MIASNFHFFGQEKTPAETGALTVWLDRFENLYLRVVVLIQVIERGVSTLCNRNRLLLCDRGSVDVLVVDVLDPLECCSYFVRCHYLSYRSMASGLSTRISMPHVV